jgi:copper(I)-binding protein
MQLKAFLLAAALAVFPGILSADDYGVGAIEVKSPWARATPRGSEVAGAYMTIVNKGTAADRLIGGSTAVASRFEIHQMAMEDGVMKMRPVADGIEVKPGQAVELRPGSFHVMLVGLKQPLRQGERLKGTLIFANAGKVDVEFAVESIGASAPSPAAGPHSGH